VDVSGLETGPGGTLGHTVQVGRLGRIDDQGFFQEVFLSMQPILPKPIPASRSGQAWRKLLNPLHQRWGGGWEPLEMTEPAKCP
jgi:hypothetical protein